jgi:hypothetical protein
MKRIRDNIFQVTYTELGKPLDRGWVKVEGETKLLLDQADFHFVNKMIEGGYEPTFYISRAKAMGGHFVVVGRKWADEIA